MGLPEKLNLCDRLFQIVLEGRGVRGVSLTVKKQIFSQNGHIDLAILKIWVSHRTVLELAAEQYFGFDIFVPKKPKFDLSEVVSNAKKLDFREIPRSAKKRRLTRNDNPCLFIINAL